MDENRPETMMLYERVAKVLGVDPELVELDATIDLVRVDGLPVPSADYDRLRAALLAVSPRAGMIAADGASYGQKSYGQIGFDKYGDEGRPEPWKTFDGRDMPRWDANLPHMAETRRRWEAAATEVLDAYLARTGLPPRGVDRDPPRATRGPCTGVD